MAGSLPALVAVPAEARTPLSYMVSFGSRNAPVLPLIWGLISISLVVTLVVTVLLLIGLFRRRAGPVPQDPALVAPKRDAGGLLWIYIGSAISAAALFGSAIWTFGVLSAMALPSQRAAFSIDVIGHQWWWEVRYEDGVAARAFTTANEIHIPIGRPVRLVVSSTDVIHSFWVPSLSGKTEAIPGQHNVTWLEADRTGLYLGECSEYCGQQHAHMGLSVVAQSPSDFQAWWTRQLEPPAQPASPLVADGEMEFTARCGVCHAVRGTRAGGHVGPDLSHLMTRGTLAAETLPNTIGNLSGWISDPQRIKPGNLMPTLDLSATDLNSIRSYLATLR